MCTVSFDPPATNLAAPASSQSADLVTQAGCAWTLGGGAGFVSGFPTSGSGPATIGYSVAENVGVGRSAVLTATLTATSAIASHTVNQASGCTASLSASSDTSTAAAGSGSVDADLR